GAVGGGEGSEGLVPGGAGFGGGGAGFGADRVGGVVVAVQFAVGADRGGAFLPGQSGCRVGRDRPEGVEGPGRGVFGGVLTDAVFAGVHQGGDLGEVGVAFGVGDGGDAGGPGA